MLGSMREDGGVVEGGEMGGRNEGEGVEEVDEVVEGGAAPVQAAQRQGPQPLTDGLLETEQTPAHLKIVGFNLDRLAAVFRT